MNFLITSVGTATSINIIKMLKGNVLIGTDINPYGYTAGSILVDKFYTVSTGNSNTYAKEIKEIVEKENIDILWPVNDIEILNIATSDQFKNVKCITPPIDTAELVRDKYECSNYVSRLGLAVPSMSNSQLIIRKKQGVGSTGIRTCNVMDDEFAQERIKGREFTIDCLCDYKGKPAFVIPRERLQVKSGVSTKCRIVKDDSLINDVLKILNKIKLPFFSNIQFIKTEDKNYFIEINPRIGGGSIASILAAKSMSPLLKEIIFDTKALQDDFVINQDVKWGLIMTRYYEEIVYEPK